MAQSSFFGQSILDYNAVADKFENFNYDYTAMANKPCINGHKLLGGENTFESLGISSLASCCAEACAACQIADYDTNVAKPYVDESATAIVTCCLDACIEACTGALVAQCVDTCMAVCIDACVPPAVTAEVTTAVAGLQEQIDAKSTVSVSGTGTATDEVCYITVNGTEHKLAGGGASIPRLAQFTYPVTAVESCTACYKHECVIGTAIATYIHSFSDIDTICNHTLLLNIDWTGTITADGLTATYERALQTVACVLPEKVSVFIPEEGMYQKATNINVRGTFMPYGETLCCCAPGNHTIEAYSYMCCYACYYPEKDCFTDEQLRELAVDCLDCTPESVSTCTKDEIVQLFKDNHISDADNINTCTTGVYDTSLLACTSGDYDVTTCVSDGCATFYVCPKS